MLLPGLWVAFLALLLGLTLRRWYDPVPLRCWLVWSAVLAVLFGAVLLGGRTLLPVGILAGIRPFTGLIQGKPPGNPLQSDLILQIAPWLDRVRETWATGEWPLWNPLVGTGEPLLGNPQSQALQPLVWLAFPFPTVSGFGVTAALRVLLALVFTWLLLRRQGLTEGASLAGSLVYGLGGFLQLWLGWPLAGSAVFLPALLYGIALADQRGERRDSLLIALAAACALLVGHPETGLHVAALAGLFALSKLRARPAGERLRFAGACVLAAGIGAGLAMPVLLPAAGFLPRSARAAAMEARHERWARAVPATREDEEPRDAGRHDPLARLVPVFAPNAFGNNRFGPYWGDRNVIEDASGFAGTVALLALLVSLGARRRFPQERLMLGVALASLVVMARPPGVIPLLESLPLLRSSMTYHSRVALLFNLAAAFVAACAWDRWRQGEVRLRGLLAGGAALAAGIAWAYAAHPGPDPAAFADLRWGSLALQLAALVAAVALLSRPSTALRSWALTAIVAVELMALHGPAHPPLPAGLYYPATPPVVFVRERLDPWHRASALGSVFWPNIPSVFGLADPRSSNPAKPADLMKAIRRIDRFPTRPTDGFTAPEDPLYALLGVRFLMTLPRERLPAPYRPVFRGGQAWVWRNPRALPRIFLPASAMPCAVPGWSDCTEGIADFGEQAAVRTGGPWTAADPGASGLDLGAIGPAEMRAHAHFAEPRLLASSVYQDGGWKLLLGGVRRPTTEANGPFVAAWLPAGDADLALLYRPGSFVAALAVAALALAAGAAFWAAPQAVRRSQARKVESA